MNSRQIKALIQTQRFFFNDTATTEIYTGKRELS